VFRLLLILFEAIRFTIAVTVERLHLSRSRLRPPQRLRLRLARLGTTFVKIGRTLSLRRDLLPDEYVEALQSLQDHVAPFPAQEAIREIERGLGKPIEELFVHFDEKPLAAASVAQAHAARLHDGREVIVMVRRPGIKARIERDMRVLRLLARCAMRVMPGLRHYEPLRIVDEIRDNLHSELDFRREARNIRKFAAAFSDWPTIYIPGVVDDLVSETVILQQRSGRRQIDDPANRAEGPRLAQNFVEAFLHQIFVLGVFHGDPHPGNLFITSDGRICFHGFGLVGSLDSDTRRQLAAYTSAFMHQEADWLLDAGIALGILGGVIDRIAFRRARAEIIADFAALPLREWSLAEAFPRVARLGRAQNVFLPHHLVVLMRALFEAESVVRTLDPEFALLQSLRVEGPDVLKSALGFSDWRNSLARLESDGLMAVHDLPAVLRSWA
jgi:ubiquinone biosynthesis protein